MQGRTLRFWLLLALCAAVGACATGRPVPARTPATTELGGLIVQAAAEQRCDAAMTMLEAVGEDDAAYRRELTQDPAVRACVDAAAPAPLPFAEPKSVTIARNYSITGGVLAPLAIPVAALVGGMLGHRDGLALGFVAGAIGTVVIASGGGFYAVSPLSVIGLGLHAVGVAAVAWSYARLLGGSDTDEGGGAGDLFLGGIASYVAGTVWDLATAGHRVRAWNRKHGAMHVVPTASGTSAGLALTGRF